MIISKKILKFKILSKVQLLFYVHAILATAHACIDGTVKPLPFSDLRQLRYPHH